MFNRWVRFLIAVIAIGAAGAAAYFVVEKEQQLARDSAAAQAAELTAEAALVTISELKATLHAYVAPGQGLPFWVARSGMLLDKLRGSLVALDPVAAASGVSLTESLDTCDRIAAVEEKIRDHMTAGHALLAGEAIFNDARDLLDAMRLQIARVRDQIRVAAGTRVTSVREEQMTLVAGAAGGIVFSLLLLVPTPRIRYVETEAPEAENAAEDDGLPLNSPLLDPEPRGSGQAPPVPLAPSAPLAPLAPPAPLAPLARLAPFCSDLARLSDAAELPALLERLKTVLEANGIILWLAPRDTDGLYPVASAGYDPNVVAKIGAIARDGANLTSAAFRAGASKTSAGTDNRAPALAVPLPSPDGPVGVLSAEIQGSSEIQAAQLAAAEIAAAQLATVIGTIKSADQADASSSESLRSSL